MSETNNHVKSTGKTKSSVDYGKILRNLLKHKKLYYKVLGIAFVVAVIFSFSMPSYYKCKVTLSPEMSSTRTASSASLSALASSFGVNLKGALGNSTEALFPTLYPDLMNSVKFRTSLFDIPVTIEGSKKKDVPDRTMSYYDYLLNEQKIPWWSAAIGGAIGWVAGLFMDDASADSVAVPEVDPFRLTKKQTRIAKLIGRKVVCRVDKKTMVISIEVTDQNPLICATMADSVKMRLQKAITDYRTNKARVDLEHYRMLLAEAKERYDEATDKYVRFADSNQKVFLQSVRQKQVKLENEVSIQRNIYQQLVAQVQQAEMRVQEDTPAFTTLENATVPVKKAGPSGKKTLLVFLFMAFVGTTVWVLYKEGDLLSAFGF